MEKIEWLIDKLKRQYDAASGTAAMLSTLQLLQQELTEHSAGSPTFATVQRISVVMPAPQWNTHATDELDAYETESLRSEDEKKVVFELEPFADEEADEEALDNEMTEELKPTYSENSVETPPVHTSFLSEETNAVSEPVEHPFKEGPLVSVTPPPSVQATVMPNPVPETDKKSLNDLHEAPLPEIYNRYHEPIKDLKKAISINDRYQYINNLFKGDETFFDRSIKTINNFNIYSEAEYWIRREVSVKYGWEESDRLVQQFYDLVSRRFA